MTVTEGGTEAVDVDGRDATSGGGYPPWFRGTLAACRLARRAPVGPGSVDDLADVVLRETEMTLSLEASEPHGGALCLLRGRSGSDA